MDSDFDDDLIEDARVFAEGPPEGDGMLPPEWGEEAPQPSTQAQHDSDRSLVQSRGASGAPTGMEAAASQASVLPPRFSNPPAFSQQLTTPIVNQASMQTPAPRLAAQSLPGANTVRTVDLAAELMAMATTGGQSQANSNSLAPISKRPREFTEPDETSVEIEEKPAKATRAFRPLATHNAAQMPTPEFVKHERLAAQHKPSGPQESKKPARDNYVFRSLNAAQAGGTKCVLIRGTSATDSVYCRMRPLWKPPKWWQPSRRAATDLLGTSIHTLLHKIEEEDIARTRSALQKLQEDSHSEGEDEWPQQAQQGGNQGRRRRSTAVVAQCTGGVGGKGGRDKADAANAAAPMLWVARHAPRSYLQLLSNENVNASVLRWLKSWDSVVFGQPEGKGQDAQAGALNRNLLAAARGTDDRRPGIKGILLSGSPGVGKTTLAHVAARHCGYRVVEINASDERSRGALLNAVNSAVQMQAVLGEKRPNCLVIDEIDGALGDGSSGGASGVRELANILRTGRISSSVKDPSGDSTGAKKGKGSAALMRPIICICNDLYAPALRPLREAAEVVEVLPPQPRMLQARLREVCNREHAAVQETALKALASKAAGDVRSCLNTLQLLSARHDMVTGSHVSAVPVGDKDMTSAPFAVWGKLLSSRPPRPGDMLTHLMSFGEHDLIMRGVHENMLEVPYMDQDLCRTAAMCDWMCDYDVCNTKIFRKQHFSLMPLLHVSTLATSNLCQTHSKVRLHWPKTGTAVTKRANATRSTLADWAASLPAPVATFSMKSAALEIAPALAAALAPPQDTLDGLLLGKPKNPAAVQAVVDHMLDYGVVYDIGAGQRLQGVPVGFEEPPCDGTPLNPPLHALHAYDSAWLNPKFVLPDAVRTMLLHKRQMQETSRQEQRAAEKATELAQHMEHSGNGQLMHAVMDSHMHDNFDSDSEMPHQEASEDTPAGNGTNGGAANAAAAKSGGGGLRSFFKVPEKRPDGAKRMHAGGEGAGGNGGDATRGGRGGDAGGNTQAPARAARQEDQSTQVRGAAGQAAAAIRGVKAPTALVNAKGNWLITMGSKVMKQRQRRVLVAEGEELKLPEGVTASQATGKLHFAVTFKFNEGYTNAVKRPLRMYDVFPGMGPAQ